MNAEVPAGKQELPQGLRTHCQGGLGAGEDGAWAERGFLGS